MLTNLPLAWTVGWPEIVVVLAVLLLLFGGKKLPELARGIGRGLREFRKEVKDVKKDVDEIASDLDEDDTDSSSRQT